MAIMSRRPWNRIAVVGLALLITASMLGQSTPSAAADVSAVRTIRLSVDNPPGNDRAAVEQKFAQLVGQLSHGRLQVQIYFSGSLGGSETTAIQSVKAGGAEMAIVGTANFSGIDNRWSMFDLPFLFAGPAGLYKYMQAAEFAQLVNSTVERDGLRYVFPYYDGWRQLVTTKKQVLNLAEEANLKLRATASPAEIAYDKAFGAKPVSVAWNEVYLALKQGLVDGLMIGYTDLIDFKMGDAVGYGTTLNVAPELVCGFMREAYFAALPKDLQQAVVAAGRQTDIFAQQDNRREEAAARTTLRAGGMKIYDPPANVRQQWVSAAQPVYANFREILSEKQQASIQQIAGH
ncbi:MAG: TRAP transporter substrate-binding protein [Vulcanimicrobiaceae bacterium]